MIKGKLQIELKDEKTGRIERHEEENMTMESTEALAIEKVRARQLMALMESTDGTGNGMAESRNGANEEATGEEWRDYFSKTEYMTRESWSSDAWIRMVLGYMIASEREYRVEFLDGSEVTVMV